MASRLDMQVGTLGLHCRCEASWHPGGKVSPSSGIGAFKKMGALRVRSDMFSDPLYPVRFGWHLESPAGNVPLVDGKGVATRPDRGAHLARVLVQVILVHVQMREPAREECHMAVDFLA
jgi:hypothetical protein